MTVSTALMTIRRALAPLLAALALAAPAAEALPAETWVVAIGNNDGVRDDASLMYAERDATEFAAVLRQHAGISSRSTTLLVGERAETVRKTLLDLNAQLRAKAGAGTPTALVVFYSGHADAESLHLGGTELPIDEIRSLVQGSPAGLRLLVVDACRSGTVTRVKGMKPTETFRLDLDDRVATEGLAILTSSAAGESSQESDRLRGSFFTHHFMNALRGAADTDDDGRISLAEAYAYTYRETLRSTGQTLTLQHPTFSYDVKGRGDVVLAEPAVLKGRLGRLRLAGADVYIVSEKREGGTLVAEVSPSIDRAPLSLAAGEYFVQRRRRDAIIEYQVAIAAGGETDLATAPSREVRYDRLVRRRGGELTQVLHVGMLAGARGETLAGLGAAPQATVTFGIDRAWGSLGVRLRGLHDNAPTALVGPTHNELGVGMSLTRWVDFAIVSVGFGVLAEATVLRQTFDTERIAPTRTAFGGAFSGLFAGEMHLSRGFALRIEGGPLTGVLPAARVVAGVETGSFVATPLTWWADGGIVWRP